LVLFLSCELLMTDLFTLLLLLLPTLVLAGALACTASAAMQTRIQMAQCSSFTCSAL